MLVEGQDLAPWELLAQFLKGMLKFLGITELVKNIKCVTVTLQELTPVQVENFQKAFADLGFVKEQYLLQDYGESFYYYILSQRRETWNRSVAWYAFTPKSVSFRKMTLDGSSKPVVVKLEEPVETELPEEGEKRDSEFCKFVQKTLGKDLFSSIQITGEGFSQDWAVQSVKILCFQKRRVFYGNNLFAKGACAAGKEKLEDKVLKGYRFLSDSLVMADVGMEMRVMGSPAYYPLIENGNNWYDCHASCELILDNTEELVFIISTFDRPEKRRVGMMLPGIPHRPNKTTRLSLELHYVSQKECRVTVRDLGFGEMFPSSGKVWTETVEW